MPTIKFNPVWKTYEKDLSSSDLETAIKASDAFETERQKELTTSKKARQWEQDRKEELARMKPEWVKKRIKKEQEEVSKMISKLTNGGIVMGSFKPAPGFVLVKMNPREEVQTETGIYLPQDVEVEEPNKGTVIAVGEQKIHSGGVIEQAPCKVGDQVMLKFNTLKFMLNNEMVNLPGFSDVLGTFED